nr:UDP-N-acetylglucosamine transferase subunit ALG14-like isoform X2 [Coffea arabica]
MENSNNHCLSITPSSLVLLSIIGFITLILIRVLYIIHRSSQPRSASSQQKPLSTLIVLGSGGHTAEMINLLNVLQKNSFTPRYYIAAATDNMSLQKAQVLESSWLNEGGVEEVGSAKFMQIYRSREVGQSYITSVGTTLIALAHALWLMIKIRPHVILCNGPETCIPLCAIAFIFKVLCPSSASVPYLNVLFQLLNRSLGSSC